MNAQSNVRLRPIAGIREVREKSRYGTLEGGEAGMSTAEMVWAVIGALIVIIVLWQIRRHGTVPPTLDVDPDDHSIGPPAS